MPLIHKTFLRIFLTGILYSLLFLFIYYGFYFSIGFQHPIVAFFLTFVISLYYHDKTLQIIRQFIDKNLYHRIFQVRHSLEKFNVELNSTFDHQLLIEKFKNFLQKTFPDYRWAFYISWGEDFERIATHKIDILLPELINRNETSLPEELDFHPLPEIKETCSDFYRSLKIPENLAQTFYVFPLKSYQDYLGFLLFDRSLNYYLYFPELKKLLLRVLRKTADMLQNTRLYSEVKRKSLQNRLLLEIGKKISASLNLEELLETIIDSIQQLVSYDAGGIFLVDRKRKILRRKVTRGYDRKLLDQIPIKINQGIAGEVIRKKKPIIINDVSKSRNYYSLRKTTRSQLTLPLIARKDVIGILVLESDNLNHFTPDDLELLMTFASQAVIAIENAQLFEASLQKKRLESELVVASKVQKALLPSRPPSLPGLKISAVNIPSRIVGGDLYDVFRLNPSELGIAIGDVSGKGAPASILMAVLYAGFKSLLKEIYTVSEVVALLNNLLTETTAEGYYATFFFGKINRETLKFTYTNAGHNAPILFHQDGTTEYLKTGGIVLGFLPDQEYHQETVQLRSGDYLLLFTDGITEVKNSEGEEFGEKRLIGFLKRNYGKTPTELKSILLNEVKNFSSRKDFSDDITIIILYLE